MQRSKARVNPRQDVRVGLVPFVTAVNVNGEGFDEAWIDRDGKSLYNGWNVIEDALRTRRDDSGERSDHATQLRIQARQLPSGEHHCGLEKAFADIGRSVAALHLTH